MFTGIVEEKGAITNIVRNQNALKLTIASDKVTEDAAIGDSISVNGVCLTVTAFGPNWFSVDVIPETYHSSSLSKAIMGGTVNLERAMQASSRFGGHFVSGHVDAVGTIARRWKNANALYVFIQIPKEGLRYITTKGSIAVDGTSLTVFDVKEDGFTISLIPETQRATVLGDKLEGDLVNIEYDMLAKYMDRLLTAGNRQEANTGSSITEDKLRQNGFLE